jgi:hypothetical protein
MDDSNLVSILKSLGDLFTEGNNLFFWQRAAG